jgi:hypothetical protein
MTTPTTPTTTGPALHTGPDETRTELEEVHVPADEGLQALLEDRHHRIEVAAYYLALHRGFTPGHEVDDWLAAEDAIEAEDAARWSED